MRNVPKAFVVGWPIEHSRSPIIHNHWLQQLGIAGSYEKLAISPESFPNFLKTFGEMGFVGGNVTLPYKEMAFETADRCEDVAITLEAANTLWIENGTLCATNTDVFGFAANLDENAPGWSDHNGSAVVLGAGGASRAILHVLQQRNFREIHIVNRTLNRAVSLANHFGGPVTAHSWDKLPGLLEVADFLVNTTSLGMAGQQNLEIDLAPMPSHALVTDVVYTPLITDLLQQADKRGLQIVDGLGMLLHQAVPGFERWFGARPKVTRQLRQLVLDDMKAGA